MEQHGLKNVNNHLNIKIYSYLETSGGQKSNLFLMKFIFSTPVLIRHLWQTKTVVFLHWCLLCTVPLKSAKIGQIGKNIGEAVNTAQKTVNLGHNLL